VLLFKLPLAVQWPPARGGAAPWLPLSEHWHEHSHGGTVAASLSTVHLPVASDLRLTLTFKLLAARKSGLCNHQAIVQPRLFDCLMVTQITLNTEPQGFDPCQGHSYGKAD
jgi:hypothetical protein